MLTISGLGSNGRMATDGSAPASASTMFWQAPAAYSSKQDAGVVVRQAAQPPAQTCPYGFTWNNGICVSDGCVTGQSQCVVSDPYGQTCSYDQYLAYWNKSGVQSCGPDPAIAAAAAAAAAQAAADAAAKAQADADAAAAAAIDAANKQASARAQAAADAEAQRQQAYANQVAAAAAVAAQAAIDAYIAAHGGDGTAPSPGMTVTPSVEPGTQPPPLKKIPWFWIGAGALGFGALVALLRR